MLSPNEIARDQIRGFSRRDLIKMSGGCAALSSTAVLGQLLNLQLTKAAVAAQGDTSGYKALVCIFLFGGIDSYNLLAPYETDEHLAYEGTRTNMAIPRAELLPITDTSGRQFGLHAGLPDLQSLFGQGKVAFLANVGSLVAPTSRTDYNNKSELPLGLFSHSDFVQHWQTSKPESRSSVTGWTGRMADMLTDTVNMNPNISMNIALNRLNIMQTGSTVTPYVVGQNGATLLSGYNANSAQNRIYKDSTDGFLGATYSDLLQTTFSQRKRGAIDGAQSFNEATSAVELTTVFDDNSLSNQLKMVARTIAARSTLQQGRQIFFVSYGGWDHHAGLITKQQAMLPVLNNAMKSFYDATAELGVQDDVTTFTASDFARTLTSNGDGSDHGWGGNQIVMGGAVNGGKVYGTYPETLETAMNDLDVGRGRLIPTTSVDEYNAELACWFGVPNDSSLEGVLPNIRRFVGEGDALPLGIM